MSPDQPPPPEDSDPRPGLGGLTWGETKGYRGPSDAGRSSPATDPLDDEMENAVKFVAAVAKGLSTMLPRADAEVLDGAVLRLCAALRAGATSEPSEAALVAARIAYRQTTAYWAPELLGSEPHIEKLVERIVAAAYAVDFGGRASSGSPE